MGYYAKCGGTLTLSKERMNGDGQLSEITDCLDRIATYQITTLQDEYLIDCECYDNYRSDEWEDFLAKIEMCTVKGEIEFRGEDGELWRFIYDPDDLQWHEEQGYVEYTRYSWDKKKGQK